MSSPSDAKALTTTGKDSHYFNSSETEDEVDDLFDQWFKQVDNKEKTVCPKTNVLSCDVCQPSRRFKKQKVLDQHNQIFHTTKKQFVCKYNVAPEFPCGQQFYSKQQLNVHQILYRHREKSSAKSQSNRTKD